MIVDNQAYIFLIFTIDGVLIGILFDFFRILRKSFKTTDVVTYIQDICFWVITGIIFLYSMCKFGNGELRFYMVLGVILGIAIYILTISRFIIKSAVFIINWLKKILIFPLKITYRFINRILIKPIKNLLKKVHLKIKKFDIKKQNNKKIYKKIGDFLSKRRKI